MLRASPEAATQNLTHAAQYSFSIIKLASSGIIMLQLHQHKTQARAQHSFGEGHDGSNGAGAAAPTSLTKTADEVPATDAVPDALPVIVVRQMLDDLQAGKLACPE